MWHRRSTGPRKILTLAALAALGAVALAPVNAVPEATITASDGHPGLRFGSAVALSGDTAVIGTSTGSPGPDGSLVDRAYVLVRRDGEWTEEARLAPEEGAAQAGYAGAVAIDGNTIVLGAWSNPHADVFVRGAGGWSREATLEPEGSSGSFWISGVAVHGDTAVLASNGGRVYVFVRSGGAWVQEATLEIEGEISSHDVAVEGDTIAVAGTSGVAHVFVRDAGTWGEQAALVAGGSDDALRGPVSLSGDTLLVASWDGPYVFGREGGSWTEQARLGSGVFTRPTFGALSGDSVVLPALVSRWDEGESFYSIVVAVYRRTGGGWSKEDVVAVGDRLPSGALGPIAISGSTFLVGSPDAEPDGTGAVYAVVLEDEPDGAGCACRSVRGSPPSVPLAAAVLVALGLARRRRSRPPVQNTH